MKKRHSKPKSAMDELTDSFMRLREEARQRMTPEEFAEADRQVHELADRIRARAHREILNRKYRSSERVRPAT
jgi:hypothetical protein